MKLSNRPLWVSVVVALASVVAQALVQRFVNNAPRGLLVVGCVLVSVLAATYFTWRVWTSKRPGSVRGPVNVPRYPLWVRVPGVIIGLAFVTLVLGLLGGEVIRVVHAWVVLGRLEPHRVAVTAAPATVRLGDQTEMKVMVDGEDADGRWTCEWSGDLAAVHRRGACKFLFQPPPGLVTRGQPDKPLRVRVTVRDAEGRWRGEAETMVAVAYAPRIEGSVSPTRIFVGQQAILSTLVDGSPAGSEYRCQWTQEEHIRSQDCRWPYTGAVGRLEPGEITSVRFEVVVWDRGGNQLGQAAVTMEVRAPPPHYFMFVFDGSSRRELVDDAARFRATRDELLARLQDIDIGGGYVGIEVFGGPRAPVVPTCENSRPLVELGPLDLLAARARLASLTAGEPVAPLALALARAVQALARYQEPRAILELVTITRGGDTCGATNLAQVLIRLRAAVDGAKLRELWLDRRLLTLPSQWPFRPPKSSTGDSRLTARRTRTTFSSSPVIRACCGTSSRTSPCSAPASRRSSNGPASG